MFSVLFLALYAVFIIMVAIEDIREKRAKKNRDTMRHSLDEGLVAKSMRKTEWEEADDLEEEAKKEFMEELIHKHKPPKGINFDIEEYSSDDENSKEV